MDDRRTLTVTQLNEYIKMMFDSQPLLRRLSVRGEISNFVDHRSGHFYFTLKDEGGVIRSVMFRSYAMKLKFIPENGMRVIVSGSVSTFPRDGQYQLYADSMQPDGVGELYVAYEQLKNKLEAEGLFSEDRKKSLPQFPPRIGIITSPTGAAIRDMINVTHRRFPIAEIKLYASAVQGNEAVSQLVSGIKYFNELDKEQAPDVIIIGRGGGSLEDLWAFNSELLARTVASSEIPIISAVGHETDFTICDFVADRRAPTPSAAAELAVPDINAIRRELSSDILILNTLLKRKVDYSKERLKRISSSRCLTDPSVMLKSKKELLFGMETSLHRAGETVIDRSKNEFRSYLARIETLNPLAVLSRGYSAVSDATGKVITSADSLRVGETINVRFADGSAYAEIIKTEVNNGKENKI